MILKYTGKVIQDLPNKFSSKISYYKKETNFPIKLEHF